MTASRLALVRLLAQVLGVLYILILVASCLTPPTQLPEVNLTDKGLHLLAFMALMGWYGLLWPRHLPELALLTTGFGGLIELLQMLTPHREAEWLDWAADGMGVLLAWLPLYLLAPRITRFWEMRDVGH